MAYTATTATRFVVLISLAQSQHHFLLCKQQLASIGESTAVAVHTDYYHSYCFYSALIVLVFTYIDLVPPHTQLSAIHGVC